MRPPIDGPGEFRPPSHCHIFGSLLGGLFGGGGGSTSVSTSTKTKVNVEVNPQIGVVVDLAPVADLASEIAAGNLATGSAVAAALSAQGAAFTMGFSELAGSLRSSVLIAAAAGLGFFLLRRAR